MADYGSRYTDRREAILDRRLMRVYREAQKDLQAKLESFVAKKEKEGQKKRAELDAGKITEDEYKRWLSLKVFQEKQWKDKVAQATEVLLQSNRKAMTLIREEQMNVFTENANWQAYDAEKASGFDQKVSFEIYDVASVDRLVREKPELLPRKVVNGRKDKAWNQGNIANVITQGIIQGESIPQIAKRMARDTASKNMRAMIRYARTAMTGAQNAGRMETMHRAQDMGISVKKQWLATLDGRTRDSHRHLDGQVQDIDDPFRSELGKIMYPGDPTAHPGDVYNCRCTLVYVYPDFPEENAMRRDQVTREEIPDITYGEWEKAKRSNRPNYTEEEKEGIDEYVSSSYSGINTALRNDEVDKYPDIKGIVEDIDSAMEKSTLSEDTVCSRGTDFYELSGLWGHRPDWYEEEEHLKSIIGKDAVVKSYTSTTKGEEALQQYASKGVEIIYDVKAGTHAIDIEKVSGRSAAKEEGEILLDRGIVIRPTRIEYTADEDGFVEGKVRIYVDVIDKNELTYSKGRGILHSGRAMANSLRQPDFATLKDEEIREIKKAIKQIKADENVFRINVPKRRTGYYDEEDIVVLNGAILPATDDSVIARDKMSIRAAIAHEYYGHRKFRGTPLSEDDWRDEFRASYTAALEAPGLTDEDRQLLMRDALDRAKDAGVKVSLTSKIRRILYGEY